MPTEYVLRFDDVTPSMAWSRFLPLKTLLQAYRIKCVLGVVPECRDPNLDIEKPRSDFYELVREWATYGDAIAQHGTHHVCDSRSSGLLKINRRSEFAGHPYQTQLARLEKGKRILQNEGIWQPWFMAPSHSFDTTTLAALEQLDFRAVTDGYGFRPYQTHGLTFIPQLASRPLRLGFGYQTICVHINTISSANLERLTAFVQANAKSFADFKGVASCGANEGIAWKVARHSSRLALQWHRANRTS